MRMLRAKPTTVVLPAVALALGATACGLETKSKKVKEEARVRTDIVGVWDAACRPSTLIPGHFETLAYDFGPTMGYTFTTRIFTDAGCTTPETTLDLRGTYSYPDEIRAGANALDLHVDDLVALVESDAVAQDWNTRAVCGFHDWQKGFEKSVLTADCGFVKLNGGEVLHQLWEVRGSQLYAGTPQALQAPAAAEARATSVDLGVPFKEVR